MAQQQATTTDPDDSMDLEDQQQQQPHTETYATTSNHSNRILHILRSRSLDESARHDENDVTGDSFELSNSMSQALHSSFDVSLLADSSGRDMLALNSASQCAAHGSHSVGIPASASSWDEHDNNHDNPPLTERAFPLRARFSVDLLDIGKSSRLSHDTATTAATTAASHSSSSGSSYNSRTPVRARGRPPSTTVKKGIGGVKLTPASAKRHRTALPRRSPAVHRVPSKTPARDSSHHKTFTPARTTIALASFPQQPPSSQRQQQPPSTALSFSGQCAPSRTLQLQEEQKVSEDRTPVHNWLTVKKAPKTEQTTLLENTSDTSGESCTPFRFQNFPNSLPRIHNNQNPTISGASAAVYPNTVRKRMSFSDADAANDTTHNTSLSSREDFPVAYNNSSDDEDDACDEQHAEPVSTPFARTRLDFNAALLGSGSAHNSQQAAETRNSDTLNMQIEGTDNVDLSHPYEQKRMSSFNSSISSHAPNNTSVCGDENYTSSTAGLTPSRPGSGGSNNRIDVFGYPYAPHTPREVQLHFQLDAAQCSPIPGIPEEDGDVSSRSRHPSKERNFLSTSTGSASTTESSKIRRLRPMPDMNAFDGDCSSPESATNSSSKLSSVPPSPKLLCPPTPVRTPAWAHNTELSSGSFFASKDVLHSKKFQRSNSLIATKILATCSPQVLDGRTSLENSILEEEQDDKEVVDCNVQLDIGDDTPMQESDELSTARTSEPQNPGSEIRGQFSETVQPQQETHIGPVTSMATSFETLSLLGSGTFADVYKVRSKMDGKLYAVKRNRRQFRGKRDRDKALAEVRCMQRLQSVCGNAATSRNQSYCLYLLFFYQAWQEEGHFYCQTELCCRDTCREMLDSLRSQWSTSKTRYPSLKRLPLPDGVLPDTPSDFAGRFLSDETIWKVCHDVCAGLSHIHAHGMVHNDMKPSNVFLVSHSRFGAMCKIGDFGMAGDIGSSEDGQEGDQKYVALELLTSGVKHPSADIFSVGLTLYEMASVLTFELPSEGSRWHEIRSGKHVLQVPSSRSPQLIRLIESMLQPEADKRPLADDILKINSVVSAGTTCDVFLRDYLADIDEFDRRELERMGMDRLPEDQTPRNLPHQRFRACSPSFLPAVPSLYSPEATVAAHLF